jgi:hypothetical protein
MRTLLICLTCLFLVQGCSVPLISNFTSAGITGASTGKYQQSIAESAFDMMVHKQTGYTPTEWVIKKLQNKKPAPHS